MRRESILIYLSDATPREPIEPLLERGILTGEIRSGGIEQAILDAASWSVIPGFMVLDVGNIEDVQGALGSLAHAAPEGNTSLILLGQQDSVEYYRRVKQMGVADYLPYPVTADHIFEAIAQLAATRATNTIDPLRTVAFLGARGGVGTSTLAAAAAKAMSTLYDRRVLMLDLDLSGGIQHVLFDKEVTPGLIQMLISPNDIDTIFLQRSLQEASKNLYLLSMTDIEQQDVYPAEAVQGIIRQAQQGLDIVVMDMPFRPQVNLSTAMLAGTIFLCTTPTFAGLRDSLATLRYLEARRYPGKIVPVLNKVREAGQLAIPKEQFRDKLKSAVVEIAYDARAPVQALLANKTVFEMRGPMAASLKGLFEELPTHVATTAGRGDKLKKWLLG